MFTAVRDVVTSLEKLHSVALPRLVCVILTPVTAHNSPNITTFLPVDMNPMTQPTTAAEPVNIHPDG